VGFRCGKKTFTLVSLHITWGNKWRERVPELKTIARWLADWAKDKNAWDTNIIAIGDFNIDNKELFEAFTSSGLTVPDELLDAPRTISERGKNRRSRYKAKFDQIAFFQKNGNIKPLNMYFGTGGIFPFDEVVFSFRIDDKQKISYYISDHYPLWVEFLLRNKELID
jgi:endonuclease/exonuclease/phosphatase family metal-dependent hydrolase